VLWGVPCVLLPRCCAGGVPSNLMKLKKHVRNSSFACLALCVCLLLFGRADVRGVEVLSSHQTYTGNWDTAVKSSSLVNYAGVTKIAGDGYDTWGYQIARIKVTNPALVSDVYSITTSNYTGSLSSFIRDLTIFDQGSRTVAAGVTRTEDKHFQLNHCYRRPGQSGVFPDWAGNKDLELTFDVHLRDGNLTGPIIDTVSVTITKEMLSCVAFNGAVTLPDYVAPMLQIEFTIGEQHAPPGVPITLDLDCTNLSGADSAVVIGYFDAELQQSVVLLSEPLLDGVTVHLDEIVNAPAGAELVATLGGVAAQVVSGDATHVVVGADTWTAELVWGVDVTPISVSGQYRILHPVSGSFGVLLDGQLVRTITLSSSPSVVVPAFVVHTTQGRILSLDLKNLVVEDGKEKWFGFGTGGFEMETVLPGDEFFEAGAYYFDFAVTGLLAGEIVGDGSSVQTETERTVVKNGVQSLEKVITSTVTRGDASTYTTVLDTGTGTQVSGDGATPFAAVPGASDAFRNATLTTMADDMRELRRIEAARNLEASQKFGELKTYLEGLNAGSLLGDAQTLFGTAPVELDPAPTISEGSGSWTLVAGGSTFDLDPASQPLAVQAAAIIKALIILLVSGWFLWYVMNQLHEFDRSLSTARQMQLFPASVFGTSFGAAFYPVVIGIMVTVFTTAPTLLSASVSLNGGSLTTLISTWMASSDTSGEIGGRLFYLLHFFLPLPHIVITIFNVVGFLWLKIWVFKIYGWVIRMIPAS